MPNPTILLIEDDPLLIKMYQTKLTMEGFEVLIATDGEEAWQVMQTSIPKVVIMDVMMPKLSGTDLKQKMSQHPVLGKIPVIMLSNLSQPSEMERAKALGVKDFLLKANFTPQQIVDKVKTYLTVTPL